MNPSALLTVLQLFSVCCCHLRSLVMMIPRSRCWSVTGNCWLIMVWLSFILLCPMCITVHLPILNISSTCWPNLPGCWCLLEALLCRLGVLLSGRVWCHQQILIFYWQFCYPGHWCIWRRVVGLVWHCNRCTLWYTRSGWSMATVGLVDADQLAAPS